MEKRNKNKKSGFTLIELVVVIAIIGVLAAVITPRVRLSLAKAKDAKAIAIVDALRTAANVYFAEQGKAIFAGDNAAAVGTGVTALINAKYLDDKADKKFKSAGVIEVGSVNGDTITAGTITLTPDTDKIGVVISTTSAATGSANEGKNTSGQTWTDL
ncbi:MAG: pilin [Cetobacterium sp.]